MSSVGKINISFTILVVFQSRRFRETFIDFSNNIFQIERGIANLFHDIWKISLIHKILIFTDRLEIRWRHQKFNVILITILVFFWKTLCSAPLMQSFIARAYLVQDLLRVGESLSPPPSYLMSKKLALVRVKTQG